MRFSATLPGITSFLAGYISQCAVMKHNINSLRVCVCVTWTSPIDFFISGLFLSAGYFSHAIQLLNESFYFRWTPELLVFFFFFLLPLSESGPIDGGHARKETLLKLFCTRPWVWSDPVTLTDSTFLLLLINPWLLFCFYLTFISRSPRSSSS